MPLPPDAKKEFRAQLKRYCLVAQKYEARWAYSQARPYSGLKLPPSGWHNNDCSSYVALAYWFAGHQIQQGVHDPLDSGYSGWGNTTTAHAYLRAHVAPEGKYRVGDVAMYLEREFGHHHMSVCIQAGTGLTAVFSSHGRTAGPEPTRLHYRSDLTDVYRHPALL